MRHSALAILLLLAIAVLLSAAAFASVNQNANSSTTTNKNQNERGIAPPQQDFSKNTWELPADADKTKNPVATEFFVSHIAIVTAADAGQLNK